MKRQTLLLVLFAACLLSLTVASGAAAQEVEQVGRYYSDNTYTTLIGGKVFDCCGGVVTWGYYSIYQIWEQEPCSECFPNDPCDGDPYCCDHGGSTGGAPCNGASAEPQKGKRHLRAIQKRFQLPETTVVRFERVGATKSCPSRTEVAK